MNLFQKLKNKLKQRLALIVVNEINFTKSEEHKKINQGIGFKSFGKNSFFWGKDHVIGGKEYLEIGENVHINNNSFIQADGGVRIGDNTHISRNLVLYSFNHDFKGDLIPYDNNLIKKEVVIGKNVWIGMNVCITPGTIIGDGCIIGMGTTVSGNIPPLSIVGSAKCVIISQRNSDHYYRLENDNRYGGMNGTLYKSTD